MSGLDNDNYSILVFFSFPHSSQSDLIVRTINKIFSVGASHFSCLLLCHTYPHFVLQTHGSAFSSLKYHFPSAARLLHILFYLLVDNVLSPILYLVLQLD